MPSQAAASREEGEQGHDLCSRCRLCPGQTSSCCSGRVVRGIMTVLDVTTTMQAGAAPTPPVRPVVGSRMPAEDWKERTWQKAEYLFLRDFLLFFFPASFSAGLSHGLLQLLYLPALDAHRSDKHSAAGSNRLCHPMRESSQKSSLNSDTGLTISSGHQRSAKQPECK